MSSDFKFLCRLLHIHPSDAIVLGSFPLEKIKGLIQFNLNIPIVFICKQLQKEVVSKNIILDKYSKSLLSIEGFNYLLNWQANMNDVSILNVNASQFIPQDTSYQVSPILSSTLPSPPLKVSPPNPTIREYKVKATIAPNPTPIHIHNSKSKSKAKLKKNKKKIKTEEDIKTVPRITFTQDYEEPKKYGE